MDSSVIILEMNERMAIVAMNQTSASFLGAPAPCNAADVFDFRTVCDLTECMQLQNGVLPAHRVLGVRPSGTSRYRKLIGLVEAIDHAEHPSLRVTALLGNGTATEFEELIYSPEIHRTFVEASSEAMWCIDFSEPVDLTLGMHEIIRQVFENECRWLMCNEAMTRLYGLPEGMDINEQPVSNYFPRNRENEAFVKEIIRSKYHVEKALSIDTSHDGSVMYMENTVRCKIRDQYLLRMWGTTRDVTGYRRVRNKLAREASDARSILDAIPDAILVIDRECRLLAVNAAFQSLFGWSPYDFFGQSVRTILDLETPLPCGRKWYGYDRRKWVMNVRVPDGSSVSCDVQSFPVGTDAPDRFVLTLYPVDMGIRQILKNTPA